MKWEISTIYDDETGAWDVYMWVKEYLENVLVQPSVQGSGATLEEAIKEATEAIDRIDLKEWQ